MAYSIRRLNLPGKKRVIREKTSDRQMCQHVNSRMRKEKESQASFKVCVLFAVSIVAVEKKLGPRLGINFLQVEEK